MITINLLAFIFCLIIGLIKIANDEDLFGAALLFLSGMNFVSFLE